MREGVACTIIIQSLATHTHTDTHIRSVCVCAVCVKVRITIMQDNHRKY